MWLNIFGEPAIMTKKLFVTLLAGLGLSISLASHAALPCPSKKQLLDALDNDPSIISPSKQHPNQYIVDYRIMISTTDPDDRSGYKYIWSVNNQNDGDATLQAQSFEQAKQLLQQALSTVRIAGPKTVEVHGLVYHVCTYYAANGNHSTTQPILEGWTIHGR